MGARQSLVSVAPVAPGEVLVVIADPTTRTLVTHHLGAVAMRVAHADHDGAIAADHAAQRSLTLDCILVDTPAGSSTPWDLMLALRSNPALAAIPVLFLTDKAPGEPEMLKMLEHGVGDYLAKPFSPTLLIAKVRAVCERQRTYRDLENKLRFAIDNAAHDALTGLYNRRYFERRMREESAHSKRHRRPLSIIMLDLDNFKQVNDTYGHEDGDRVLRHVAEIVQAQLRDDDVPCRYGGEELVLLLRATTGKAACVVANRLRTALASRPLRMGSTGEVRAVTFSAGVAAADERNAYDVDELLSRADAALYKAKRAGKNRVEMEERAQPATNP